MIPHDQLKLHGRKIEVLEKNRCCLGLPFDGDSHAAFRDVTVDDPM